MRKLKTTDIMAFCRTLKKIGIKDELNKIAKEANNAKDAWDKGFDLIWDIFDRATEAQGEWPIYEFLAGPFEMTAEEVANLDIADFIRNLKQLAAENDLLTFFKFAEQSMK